VQFRTVKDHARRSPGAQARVAGMAPGTWDGPRPEGIWSLKPARCCVVHRGTWMPRGTPALTDCVLPRLPAPGPLPPAPPRGDRPRHDPGRRTTQSHPACEGGGRSARRPGRKRRAGRRSFPYFERPRQDSNLRNRLRRAVLYPLSYGGSRTGKEYQSPALPWTGVGTAWRRLGHVVAETSRDTLASRRGAGSGTRTRGRRR
jgi:hypothetical protein